MKLKLTTKPQPAPDGAPPPTNEAPTPTPTTAGPKLKFKNLSAPSSAPTEAPPAEPPKQKRKYTKKPKVNENGDEITVAPKAAKPRKRAREENGDDASPAAKRKPKPTAKSLALIHSEDDMEDELATAPATVSTARRAPPVRTGSMLKIKMKSNGHPGLQRSGTAMIKIKGVHGKPPVRPPGVGYDSEAEEAEEDPAIESQFVLRMQPGPDCDLLRKAVEEKKIGKPSGEGGTNVQFRFFDREGRRALVSIHGRLYAACMVDLPCILESMKSWNKKDWVKSADVCQMLLVLGRVQSEEEAKKFPFPREVDASKHQYAHGLTPPMHWVRKRRFRPRKSYHQIEKTEAEFNALLADDDKAIEQGGRTEWTWVKSDASDAETSEEGSEDEDEDIAETTEQQYVIEGETPGGEEVEVDGVDDNELLEAALAGLVEEEDGEGNDVAGLFGGDMVETPVTAHDVAIHALGEDALPIAESAASTPNAVTSPDDDDDDDDDDAESPGDEVNAEVAAAQADREEKMGEIRMIEQEIARAWEQYHSVPNMLFKKRQKTKIEQYENEIAIKKAALGIGEDDGD